MQSFELQLEMLTRCVLWILKNASECAKLPVNGNFIPIRYQLFLGDPEPKKIPVGKLLKYLPTLCFFFFFYRGTVKPHFCRQHIYTPFQQKHTIVFSVSNKKLKNLERLLCNQKQFKLNLYLLVKWSTLFLFCSLMMLLFSCPRLNDHSSLTGLLLIFMLGYTTMKS